MRDPLPVSLSARLIAAFLVFGGLAGAVLSTLGLRGPNPEALVLLHLGMIASGLLAWFAPWDRWGRRSLFGLVVLGLLIKTASNVIREADPFVYAIHYVALYMWIGISLPRWSGFAAAPLMLASYLAPMVLLGRPTSELVSAAVVAPVCLFIGEAASWLATRLRESELRSEGRALKMAALVDGTTALACCRDEGELARLTAIGAAELFGGSRAIVLLEDERGRLRRAGELNAKPEAVAALLAEDVRELLLDTMRRPEMASVSSETTAHVARILRADAVELLPLSGSGDSVGVAIVSFDGPREAADEFTAYVTRTLATQAGLALERVRDAQNLLDISLRDPLTGIGNRRKAMAALETLKPGDVVALIDLDRFKAVNDSYGHAAGDRVLRSLADFLRNAVRAPDEVFRFGGEEFLIALAGAGDAGTGVIERIHDRWCRQERVTTFSAGVAVHAEGESVERTLARADAALYDAKRGGRDRVVARPASR